MAAAASFVKCQMCEFNFDCNDAKVVDIYLNHVKYAHISSSKFTAICPVRSCAKPMATYTYFRRHCYEHLKEDKRLATGKERTGKMALSPLWI